MTAVLFFWQAQKKGMSRKGTISFLMATILAGELMRYNCVNNSIDLCLFSNAIATAATGRTSFSGISYATTAKNVWGLIGTWLYRHQSRSFPCSYTPWAYPYADTTFMNRYHAGWHCHS